MDFGDSDFLNADGVTPGPFASIPFTISETPFVPDGAVIKKREKHADVIPIKHRT